MPSRIQGLETPQKIAITTTLAANDFCALVTLLVELSRTIIVSNTTREKARNCASISRSQIRFKIDDCPIQ